MEKELNFSCDQIRATWHGKIRESKVPHHIGGRAILVNLSPTEAVRLKDPNGLNFPLRPLSSSVFHNVSILEAESVVLLRVEEDVDAAAVAERPDWEHLAKLMPSFPAKTPLFKSPQDNVGSDEFTVSNLLQCHPVKDEILGEYEIRLNLWFAPAKTNCLIHNHATDQFLEIHTQVAGLGRMQKFKKKGDYDSIYEDVMMAPGMTHAPFATSRRGDDGFVYPWHQYYADTPSIWMAIEFHPVT